MENPAVEEMDAKNRRLGTEEPPEEATVRQETMDYELQTTDRSPHRRMLGSLAALALVICSSSFLLGQQPNPQPIYKANAEGVQGVGPGNWISGATVSLYVNASTGNDSTGNGTSTLPYASISRAIQDIPAFVSQNYVINLAPGTYYGEVDVQNRYFAGERKNVLGGTIEILGSAAFRPAAPAVGQSAGGTLAATTYYTLVTYVNSSGETLPSSESSKAVAADNMLTVTSPSAEGDAAGYNVYVSTSSGAETKQNSSAIAIGTNWTEPASGLIAGAAMPSSDTTPDAYVISGATAGAPTTASSSYSILASHANLILTGVSLQYATVAGLDQRGGNMILYGVNFRNFSTAGATADVVEQSGHQELDYDFTISNAANGLLVHNRSDVWQQTPDYFNIGNTYMTGEVYISGISGAAVEGYDHAFLEFDMGDGGEIPPAVVSCTGASGSIGLAIGDYSDEDGENYDISGCQTGIEATVRARVELNGYHSDIIANATTGVLLQQNSYVDFLLSAPSFSSVTTNYSIANGSLITTPTTNYWDGSRTALGAVNLSAGAANNVTIQSGASNYALLNPNGGSVGIGTTNPLAPFVVSNAGAQGIELFPNGVSFGTTIQAYNRSGGAYDKLDFNALSYGFRLSSASADAVTVASSGDVGIGTTTPETSLDVAGAARTDPTTTASLPTCSSTVEGAMRTVSDSTTNTWGATITGGGSDVILGFCDGTNWTVAGK